MADFERREPTLGTHEETQGERLGGVASDDRPVTSRESKGGLGTLLVMILLVGGGWAIWTYTDIVPRLFAPFLPNHMLVRESTDLVEESERLLGQLGLEPGPADGELDPATVAAIKAYQESAGLTADGTPSRELLETMRSDADGTSAP